MGLLANPVYCVEKSTSKFSSVLTYDVPVYLTTKMMISDISKEIVYLKSIRKADGEIETHVFDNTKGETLTRDYLYFVKVTDLQGNVTVEESRIYAFDEFPHQKVYGTCDAKCKVEVVTKKAFDEYMNYYKPVKISKSDIDVVVSPNGTLNVSIGDLPEGFNYANSKVIAVSCRKNGSATTRCGYYNKLLVTADISNPVIAVFHNYTNEALTATELIVDVMIQHTH